MTTTQKALEDRRAAEAHWLTRRPPSPESAAADAEFLAQWAQMEELTNSTGLPTYWDWEAGCARVVIEPPKDAGAPEGGIVKGARCDPRSTQAASPSASPRCGHAIAATKALQT